MAMLGANQLVQMRRQRERSLQDTCVITPSVRPGETATPVTVPCNVLNRPRSGGDAGGGNAIRRSTDRTIVLPFDTVVSASDLVRWTATGEDIRVADVETPGSFGMVIRVHGAIVNRP